MTRKDPLHTVHRLRLMEVDAARTQLIQADECAHQATHRAQQAAADIQAEMDLASSADAEDAVVEAFGAWLPKGRRAVAEAVAATERAQQSAAQARARLNVARRAAEAVATLLQKKALAATTETLHREQQTLDEAGLRRSKKTE